MPAMAAGCKGAGVVSSENEAGMVSLAAGLADGATELTGIGIIPDALFVPVLELPSKPVSTLFGGDTGGWMLVAGSESPTGMMKDI